MVTIGVSCLMFCGDSGQTERSPVGVAADDAARPDDLGTSITGDSEGVILAFNRSDSKNRNDGVHSDVLSHLVEAARANLSAKWLASSNICLRVTRDNSDTIETYNGNQLVQHGIEGWRALETKLESMNTEASKIRRG